MDSWGKMIDEEIRKVIGNGEAASLPGAGKPLNLDQDANTRDDMRLAYKIMRENNLAPEWIMMSEELEDSRRRLLDNLQRGIKAYRGAVGDAIRSENPERAAERRQNADAGWRLTQQKLQQAFDAYNRKIISFNLKLPDGINRRPHLDLQREIERLTR